MNNSLSIEVNYLLSLLRQALTGFQEDNLRYGEISEKQWAKIINQAEKHSVLSLIYDVLLKVENIPVQLIEQVGAASRRIVLQNYKLLYYSNDIIHLLESEGIPAIVLKGVGTAVFYPVPELRKSGDVDILIGNPGDISKACKVLEAQGFVTKKDQHSMHHTEYVSREGIVIELHTMLAEPFDNQRMNDYLAALYVEYWRHYQYKNIMGSSLPVPEDGYHAYYLLLHMLQHFLRAGFGLKLLCDWVVFWNSGVGEVEQENYLCLVRESGLTSFSDSVTAVCIDYLGLEKEKVHSIITETTPVGRIVDFMREIIEAEEFGQSTKDRMVLIRGNILTGYVREFHHQMRLNYPEKAKYFYLWPVLWIATLITFLINNYKIRKISVGAVLRKARSRSRNLKAMKLFKVEKK